jgi:hypothetical protein
MAKRKVRSNDDPPDPDDDTDPGTPVKARRTKMATRKVSRSAKSGKFVKDSYAKKHPATTERETVPVRKPKSKK